MRPLVLVTRPWADAEPLARKLQAIGVRPVIEPVLSIEPVVAVPFVVTAETVFAVTSANGARALARHLGDDAGRAAAVFAVGDGTADCLRALGFARVTSASGDVDALFALMAGALDRATARIVHVSGADAAGDLVGRLGRAGFRADRHVLYRAVPAARFSEAARRLFAEKALAVILLFSPRTGAGFVRLVNRDELGPACRSIMAVCLSPRVAAAVDVLPWRGIVVAAQPTQDALIDEVARLLPAAAGRGTTGTGR